MYLHAICQYMHVNMAIHAIWQYNTGAGRGGHALAREPQFDRHGRKGRARRPPVLDLIQQIRSVGSVGRGGGGIYIEVVHHLFNFPLFLFRI